MAMTVADIMTPKPQVISVETPIMEAARIMQDLDVGFIPVEQNDQLVGMLTDRDIVLNVVARSLDASTATAGETMSDNVFYCFDDQSIEEASRMMGDLQVRRLPVVDRKKNLVGVVSLGDIVRQSDVKRAAAVLEKITSDRASSGE